ncbi:hypothetical protein E2C01_102635 [Portunus trituberculatus]|uniref:Uncharacterized protein n=1 Tax=Portunus trituberculatus TaxID=210409 RepID=A0A5B7KJ02_PORTR|nr:hypothetical protein [Portunus trituberculatus]
MSGRQRLGRGLRHDSTLCHHASVVESAAPGEVKPHSALLIATTTCLTPSLGLPCSASLCLVLPRSLSLIQQCVVLFQVLILFS